MRAADAIQTELLAGPQQAAQPAPYRIPTTQPSLPAVTAVPRTSGCLSLDVTVEPMRWEITRSWRLPAAWLPRPSAIGEQLGLAVRVPRCPPGSCLCDPPRNAVTGLMRTPPVGSGYSPRQPRRPPTSWHPALLAVRMTHFADTDRRTQSGIGAPVWRVNHRDKPLAGPEILDDHHRPSRSCRSYAMEGWLPSSTIAGTHKPRHIRPEGDPWCWSACPRRPLVCGARHAAALTAGAFGGGGAPAAGCRLRPVGALRRTALVTRANSRCG